MRLLVVVGLFAFAAWLVTGITQVRPGERGVVRRFGRVVELADPGLRVGWPAGIEQVERVAIDRVRSVTIGYQPAADDEASITPIGQLLTGDHNLVNVQVIVDYTVREADLEAFVVQQQRVEGLVSRVTEALLTEWIAGRTVDEVLIRGKVLLPRLLVQQVQQRLEPYHLGIQVQSASVAHLLPPIEVKPAFDEVTRAQTAINTREHEARQEAGRRLREAEAERYRLEQLATAYRNEQLQFAETDAASFLKRLEQYQRLRKTNPDLLSAIWWDEMGRVFTRMKQNGRIDLLDTHLTPDGLDITLFGPQPGRK